MPRIEGLRELIREMETLRKATEARVSVIVGYTAKYALYVHENVDMKWRGKPRASGKGSYWDPPGRGQSKFLEQPAREMQGEIADRIRRAMHQTKSMEKSLLVGGLVLQRASQLLVPVDTGNLKASAFTRKE